MKYQNWQKFPALFSLYIAQSIPMSFFSTVVPVILRQESYSLQSIGMLQLLKLPWIVKFLWAPYVDNYARNSRDLKRLIVASEIFYAAVIILIGVFDLETDFKLVIILIITAFVASATQDIATDAFAILSLSRRERGLGNSLQSAGSFVGTIFGTGVLLIAYDYFGWTMLLHLLAVFVLFALVPLYFLRKQPVIHRPQKDKVSLKDVYTFFKRPGIYKVALLLIFIYSGITGTLSLLKPLLVDLGYDAKEIGFMSGIVGTSSASLAALAAGYVVRRIGVKRSLFLFLTFTFLTNVFYYFFIAGLKPTLAQIYLAIIFIWVSYGCSTVAIYTFAMNRVRGGREGTDFTLQIVFTHFSSILVVIATGRVGDIYGYKGAYLMAMILVAIAYLILFFYYATSKHNPDDEPVADQ